MMGDGAAKIKKNDRKLRLIAFELWIFGIMLSLNNYKSR